MLDLDRVLEGLGSQEMINFGLPGSVRVRESRKAGMTIICENKPDRGVPTLQNSGTPDPSHVVSIIENPLGR